MQIEKFTNHLLNFVENSTLFLVICVQFQKILKEHIPKIKLCMYCK